MGQYWDFEKGQMRGMPTREEIERISGNLKASWSPPVAYNFFAVNIGEGLASCNGTFIIQESLGLYDKKEKGYVHSNTISINFKLKNVKEIIYECHGFGNDSDHYTILTREGLGCKYQAAGHIYIKKDENNSDVKIIEVVINNKTLTLLAKDNRN